MMLENRKRLRLPQFDYSSNGAYFITICTQNKEKLFGEPGRSSRAAEMIAREWEEIIHNYTYLKCFQYVVMPNHVHMLVMIDSDKGEPCCSISDIIRVFKSKTTVEYIKMVKSGNAMPFKKKLWQRSYYDHVIRNEQDFQEAWQYIESNPRRRLEDDYY